MADQSGTEAADGAPVQPAQRRRGLAGACLHVAQSNWVKLRNMVRGLKRLGSLAKQDEAEFKVSAASAGFRSWWGFWMKFGMGRCRPSQSLTLQAIVSRAHRQKQPQPSKTRGQERAGFSCLSATPETWAASTICSRYATSPQHVCSYHRQPDERSDQGAD